MPSSTYRLEFNETAAKEWRKLDRVVREQFQARLIERLARPRVQSAALRGLPDCYKIKLRSVGYRLVYRVDDGEVVVIVISIGRRDASKVYRAAEQRLRQP